MSAASEADRKAAWERRKALVKQRLRDDMRRLARELVPKGRLSGQTWSGLPPHRNSDNPTAFAVYVGGAKAGGWIDFVSGEKGDALQLVMLAKGLNFTEAMAWAEDRYGLRNLSTEQREALNRDVEKRQRAQDEDEAARRARKIRSATLMFSKAEASIAGTLADRYLLSRGIDLRALPFRETRWLRFLPRATYWMDAARPQRPAMIAGLVDGAGVMKACHLTFLRDDGRGKADVTCRRACGRDVCRSKGCQNSAKLMWPEVKGLVIRLNRGATGLDCEAAAAAGQVGPLVLCEGVEDGLSVAMGDEQLRVHAAASLVNLASVPDLACASSYIVAQDNDWGKAQAKAGFAKGLRHLMTFRKPVVPVRSTVGKDFNNQLQEQDT